MVWQLLPPWVWVALGSAVGGVARFAVARWWPWVSGAWPVATMSVNILGSALIGVLSVALAGRDGGAGSAEVARLFWMTGVLGGFTTYSAFALETAVLAGEGALTRALLYVIVTVLGCLLAAIAGRALGVLLLSEV